MSDEIVQQALALYGLPAVRVLPAQKGYRNESYPVELEDGRRLNFILYKREPGMLARIRRANSVADWLATRGFPTRTSADPRILQLRAGPLVRYGALYTWLPGKTIPWETYTMEHLKQLGQVMSDMHASLESLPKGGLPLVADEYAQILGRMERYFAQPAVAGAMRAKLGLTLDPAVCANYQRLVRAAGRLPRQQPLHMDFVRGNVLFEDHHISGILDFEKTAYGPPLFDIARTLAFLLVDCKYKPEEKTRKYFLQSGYQKRGAAPLLDVRLQPPGTSLLEALMNLFLLHDFYKFLRHNPYEFLSENEHFIRTRAMLLERGLLQT